MKHRHPTLQRAVPVEVFLDEVGSLWSQARIPGRLPTITIGEHMDDVHHKKERRYAEVQVSSRHFYFASCVLFLPARNRRALIRHEIGHVLHPKKNHSEKNADNAAQARFKRPIRYDRRWGGRGLQSE